MQDDPSMTTVIRDLFADDPVIKPASERHDPGGKRRLRMLPGMTGAAGFSECGRYRSWLSRTWDEALPVALWIGMNPSTATEEVDDPTIRAELDFSKRWGYGRYLKANVMDFRATRPADLRRPGIVPRSPVNLEAILRMAAESDILVLGFGALHPKLLHHGLETIHALEKAGFAMHHLVATRNGLPGHPLYVARMTPLAPYRLPDALRLGSFAEAA